jgi:predicted dehydrogenase
MKPLRWAIFGCGNIAENMDVVADDPDPDSADQYSRDVPLKGWIREQLGPEAVAP